MPGGLFAIRRDFFTKLGTYDPELKWWGGENIELSLKAWQCGGSVEVIPCSHVGHVFRKQMPHSWDQGSDVVKVNNIRVAEVWADDYKNYYYEASSYLLPPFGDVSERKRLRENLGCQNFDWYIKNVHPDIEIPLNMLRAGQVKNDASSTCLDSKGGGSPTPGMYPCFNITLNQACYLSTGGDLMMTTYKHYHYVCGLADGAVVLSHAQPCHGDMPQRWLFTQDRHLLHQSTNLCLMSSKQPGVAEVTLKTCADDPRQRWTFPGRRTDRRFPVPQI